MASHRSLDEYELIAALLRDVAKRHGTVFNNQSLRLTLSKVRRRLQSEGIGFLTKTLPKLGKCLDKALAEQNTMDASLVRLNTLPGSKLPKLFGELFQRVFDEHGMVLREPCTQCIATLRQLCYLFYKYELPYTAECEQQVIDRFVKTEQELLTVNERLEVIRNALSCIKPTDRLRISGDPVGIARKARILLSKVFASFDPLDIDPKHGPGAVATRQRPWEKYNWTNVCGRITDKWPLDAYFFASLTHVCDRKSHFDAITDLDLPARVVLVPKDSRGPRLISCEPPDFQWIQQGMREAMVKLVESHELTQQHVHFTHQEFNRWAALSGSTDGRYATLDLKDASDRVSLELVRLLFPPHIVEYLEACRSSATVLPSGEVLTLRKFAPMGSSLCFPIMALTIWAILAAGSPDADTQECILVYGDDVIVPQAHACNAIEQLESFGLQVNRDKSCTKGFFRESCGVDAYKGIDVTPVKLKTVWSPSHSPDSYLSWLAYCQRLHDNGLYGTYDYIVRRLCRIYWPIPTKDLGFPGPSLPETPDSLIVPRAPSRWNQDLQKVEYLLLCPVARSTHVDADGWLALLRYFAEKANHANRCIRHEHTHILRSSYDDYHECFRVGQYTQQRMSKLVRSWR